MGRRAFSRASITARLFNTPLAVTADTAAIVLGAVGRKFDVSQLFVATDGQRVTLGELEEMAAAKRVEIGAQANIDQRAPKCSADSVMPVIDGVAFVEVRGELVSENGIGPESGFTGYDGITAQIAAADADAGVKGIIADINCPGGEVDSLYECVGALMARRGTKPMRAVIRGMGASAAYAIAACADEITVHELGYAGSIGTIMMHADFSASLAQDGIKVTLITAGDHKADGNPFEPLPEEVKARFDQLVNSANDRFIAHVAAARGMAPDAVRAQQAQIYRGQEAVDAGLVDKVMSWSESIAEFTAQVNTPAAAGTGGIAGRSARPAPGARSSQETIMPDDQAAPAGITPEDHQTALAAATTAAQTAERARIAALTELAGADDQTALSAAIADGTSAGDFAIALNSAQRTQQAAALAAAQDDAAGPAILPTKTKAGNEGGEKVNRGTAIVAKLTGKHPGLPAKA